MSMSAACFGHREEVVRLDREGEEDSGRGRRPRS